MLEEAQEVAYERFIQAPSAKTAFEFILTCHSYIEVLATKWKATNLCRKAKITEIMTEMFLVLLESFCKGKAVACQSALAYLDVCLKKVIFPKESRLVQLETVNTESLGRAEMTALEYSINQIEMMDEIVEIVRRFTLFPHKTANNDGLLPFLFIHVCPKISWVSNLLAQKDGLPEDSRYEADSKRIKRFNSRLQTEFNKISCGDWRDIRKWSTKARRHLAWNIIGISPCEVEEEHVQDLRMLAKWRDHLDSKNSNNLKGLAYAENVWNSMSRCMVNPIQEELWVAEEAEPWGESPNILSLLMGDLYEESHTSVEENHETVPCFESSFPKLEEDVDFMEVAKNLSNWFGNMLEKRKTKACQKAFTW